MCVREPGERAIQYCLYYCLYCVEDVAAPRCECPDVFGTRGPLHATRTSPPSLVFFTALAGIWYAEQPATYATLSVAATSALAISTADIGAHNDAAR